VPNEAERIRVEGRSHVEVDLEVIRMRGSPSDAWTWNLDVNGRSILKGQVFDNKASAGLDARLTIVELRHHLDRWLAVHERRSIRVLRWLLRPLAGAACGASVYGAIVEWEAANWGAVGLYAAVVIWMGPRVVQRYPPRVY
jgi:hypothetical protein